MVDLVLPSHLYELLPKDERLSRNSQDAVPLDAGSWPELVAEVRHRFPNLAKRVLTEMGSLARRFVLVIDDKIISQDHAELRLGRGSQVIIIPTLAGG
jgi:molybdopterin converting factor small subunit